MLLKAVKQRTQTDINVIGIKKMLIGNGGSWFSATSSFYKFTADGKVYLTYKTQKEGYFYWKFENGTLYINPNKIPSVSIENKFLPMIVSAEEPSGYNSSDINTIKKYKYSIVLKTSDEKIYIYIHQLY